mgnify:CR=1 FL=1
MSYLHHLQEREAKRAEDRKIGARILQQQIEDRARERERQQDLREKERREILANIERLQIEEEEALLVKKERGRKLLAEVQAGNQQQIELKKQVLQVSSCYQSRKTRQVLF